MSEVKVNKITPTTNCGTVTLGDSGDTFALPAGVTLTSAGSITNSGTITNTGTISGGTITGTIDGLVSWDTTAKTTGFTAVAGNGYFVNTTSGAITVTLPATPSAGDLVGIKDYAGTSATNKITVARNGSNIQGVANNYVISTAGRSIILIYVDGTQGWVSTGASQASDITEENQFIIATGGTITTCGDYKIHTFTGPGTFCVSCAGVPANANADYLVVAGGGGGAGRDANGGGGAGGFRLSNSTCMPAPQTSPLATPTGLPISATGYPITVGAGGAGAVCSPSAGCQGSNSIFSTITSTGGGGGGPYNTAATSGGSGGGAGRCNPSNIGSGNTPPVSPSQGNDGGYGSPGTGNADSGGGGGGASQVGFNGLPGSTAGGGAGSYVVGSGLAGCNGTPGPVCGARYFAGGGGGAQHRAQSPASPGPGGVGGGGAGAIPSGGNGNAGTTNTGGGGGSSRGAPATGGSGGSGIVIIRYKYQ